MNSCWGNARRAYRGVSGCMFSDVAYPSGDPTQSAPGRRPLTLFGDLPGVIRPLPFASQWRFFLAAATLQADLENHLAGFPAALRQCLKGAITSTTTGTTDCAGAVSVSSHTGHPLLPRIQASWVSPHLLGRLRLLGAGVHSNRGACLVVCASHLAMFRSGLAPEISSSA